MEHDLGAVLLEHLEDAVAVADVGEDEGRRVEQGPALELELGGVEARLVAVEHHQGAGSERPQLAAQLGADRAAGAGDQDPPAGDVTGDRRGVDLGRVAAEEVGDGDRADVRRPDMAEELGDRREHQHPQAGVEQRCGEGAQPLAGDRRDRHQHRASRRSGWRRASASAPVPRTRSPLSCMRARRGSSSSNATGRYGLSGLRSRFVVIWSPRVAGAEHDDRLGPVVGWAQVTVLDEPGHVAADHGQHEREERREHRHRAGDQRAAEEAGEDERGDADDGDAEAEHADLLEAAVVVPAAVQAERQTDDPLQDDRNGNDRRATPASFTGPILMS